VNYLKVPSDDGQRPYSSRYIGTAIADIHRTLFYGGIFMYPSDAKSPNGKLRLIYEVNPLAAIIEEAGGRASNGLGSVLELQPESIHQRVPVFMGSEDDVNDLELFLRGEHPAQLSGVV
jgi:fructose-1,6-bisphosphatase I